MAEYVSKETLLKAVEKMDRLDKETNTKYEYNKQGYILLIENAPTADVEEVKHGEWSRGTEPSGSVYAHCSACNRKMNYSCYGYARCSLCGAKMDGGKE